MNRLVGNGGTGSRLNEVNEEIKGADSRGKVKHNEKSDHLF